MSETRYQANTCLPRRHLGYIGSLTEMHDWSNLMFFVVYWCLCRASLLTGRRPDTTHVWVISPEEYWRQTVNATTIPQYFKENGVSTPLTHT